MYIKIRKEKITWIPQEFLTKEVAQDIAGFWLDTEADKLCTARMGDDNVVSHYWFNTDTNEWEFLKRCE